MGAGAETPDTTRIAFNEEAHFGTPNRPSFQSYAARWYGDADHRVGPQTGRDQMLGTEFYGLVCLSQVPSASDQLVNSLSRRLVQKGPVRSAPLPSLLPVDEKTRRL
jgi:hypothetical protein